MKRAGNLIHRIADPDNLRLAFWKAGKGKRYSKEVEAYRKDLDKNLRVLREQILRGEVNVGDYFYFKIFDPKERDICAAAFSEQVLHHALMNICHDSFERVQIFDSYASRKGKGTHAAIERAKLYAKQYTFYLKLDVKQFFASLDHDVLKHQVRHIIKDPITLLLFDTIIDSYASSPNRGVPIGNLTSQYLANHYLSPLDHFIKDTLQVKGYVRYMDDMVLWHDDKAVLLKIQQAIHQFLDTELHCSLKQGQLNYTAKGLPFVGYLIFPHFIRLTQRSKSRFFRKIANVEAKYHSGEWTEEVCQIHARPLLAFVRKADSQKQRIRLFTR
jgi:RNA-directed DNA polymerase